MNSEYGGVRSMGEYIRNKNKRTPLSYTKKYSVEIQESSMKYPLNNNVLIFTNCNFYIDDLISLSTVVSPSNANTPYKEWGEIRIKTEHMSEEEKEGYCATEFSQARNFVDPLFRDSNNVENLFLGKTPIKNESWYDDKNTICTPSYELIDESNITNQLTYKNHVLVQNEYINKKENIEILIVQNGGRIHNALTNEVTHIISNNMALGNKKYADFKRKMKKSKIFIVEDTYVFDCVKANSRLCEQLYLPKILRYNSRQITEFFPFNKKRKRYQSNLNMKNTPENNEGVEKKRVQNFEESLSKDFSENISSFLPSEENKENNLKKEKNEAVQGGEENIKKKKREEQDKIEENELSEKMEILLMGMSYEDLKKYLIHDCNAYFKKLYKYYCDKEYKENRLYAADLYLNEKNFENFARKYKIMNFLTEEEMTWIKNKSKLNLRIRNIWENDFIHFFFNMVLWKSSHLEKTDFSISYNIIKDKDDNQKKEHENDEYQKKEHEKDEYQKKENEKDEDQKKENEKDEYQKKEHEKDEDMSDKLIDSISGYFSNSRLYILGNWSYITKALFDFNDIQVNPSMKCVYLYIDFDYYFLNASLNKYNSPEELAHDANINNSIFCVCHSTKKEDSFGLISSINYWAAKNKIYKGMLKKEAVAIANKNIHFIRYNFSNILKCSFLFLLVLMNYSQNIKVSSVDESVLQLFYTKEEEIVETAKKISKDIYDLTHLSVTIGISDNIEVARHALKFCKKRFMFFDFYHHFCIFIRQYIDWQKVRHLQKKKKEIQEQKRNEMGQEEAMQEETIMEAKYLVNIDQLFDAYLKYEEKKRNRYIGENEKLEQEKKWINMAFLKHVNQMDEEVEDIFKNFTRIHQKNMENIMNLFFTKIVHPVSKYFFFYLQNDFYLNILKNCNYMKGEFIDFNIYYLKEANFSSWVMENKTQNIVDENGNNDSNGNKICLVTEGNKTSNKKAFTENVNDTKSMSIRANYGIRFHKINDFYYLIYFMTKQLYLRLKIKNSKAKNLNINFFLREENESVDPVKYLGRGKVINLRSHIKLNQHTDSFFVYFFKIIYKFQFIMHKIEDLRGIQLTCSDIIKETYKPNKRSILYYFTNVTKKEDIKSFFKQNQKNTLANFSYDGKQKDSINSICKNEICDNNELTQQQENKIGDKKSGYNQSRTIVKKSKSKSKKKNIDKENKKIHENKITDYIMIGSQHATRKSRNDNAIRVEKKKRTGTICSNIKHILCYFVENINEIESKNKLINKITIQETFQKKNFSNSLNTSVSLKKNEKSVKSKITRNYKISDFFPNIIIKTSGIDAQAKACSKKKKTVEHVNLFDSIINVGVKIEKVLDTQLQVEKKGENQEMESVKKNNTCCYRFCLYIYNTVKEKQNKHDEKMNDCTDYSNQSLCYACICNRLNAMNKKNEKKFYFYLYVKNIFSCYISYFMNMLENHKCDVNKNEKANANIDDENYLYEFLLYILNDICDLLHRKRFLDVLHKLLEHFICFWESQKISCCRHLLQSILNRYLGNNVKF